MRARRAVGDAKRAVPSCGWWRALRRDVSRRFFSHSFLLTLWIVFVSFASHVLGPCFVGIAPHTGIVYAFLVVTKPHLVIYKKPEEVYTPPAPPGGGY